MLAGTSLLITGGTGSFGTACIQYLLQSDDCPRRIICFSRDELKQSELAQRFGDPRLRFFLGDVRDLDRLSLAFHDVQYVIHAAALKQVPALEYNPTEAVRTNILGSMNVMLAALGTEVRKVIALSTDKAVSPVNLYGATKLCMERVLIAGNAYRGGLQRPSFSVVRYGNVAGSRGSVIPLWKDRAAKKLPLLLTHAKMSRFWITLPEAVAFTLRALREAEGGETFIPKLPSVRLAEIAALMSPDIRMIGVRPGEKIHEALLSGDEQNVRDLDWCYAVGAGERGAECQPFAYHSDLNARWLAGTDLQQALAAL